MKPAALVAIALALAAGVACNNNSTSTAPSSSTARTTDSFSGTVNVAASDFHGFTISKTGEVDVTLTSAGPPSTITMGVALGVVTNSMCQHIAGAAIMTAAGTSVQLGALMSPTTACVDVYDIGNQTAAVTYSITVVHP